MEVSDAAARILPAAARRLDLAGADDDAQADAAARLADLCDGAATLTLRVLATIWLHAPRRDAAEDLALSFALDTLSARLGRDAAALARELGPEGAA